MNIQSPNVFVSSPIGQQYSSMLARHLGTIAHDQINFIYESEFGLPRTAQGSINKSFFDRTSEALKKTQAAIIFVSPTQINNIKNSDQLINILAERKIPILVIEEKKCEWDKYAGRLAVSHFPSEGKTLEQLDKDALDKIFSDVAKTLCAILNLEPPTVKGYSSIEIKNATIQTANQSSSPEEPRSVGADSQPISQYGLPSPPRIFINRKNELNKLNQAWLSTPGTTIAITGPAGVGKTALVAYWLAGLKNELTWVVPTLVWSFNKDGPASSLPVAFLNAIGQPVGESDPNIAFNAYIHEHRCIIILDDIDALDHSYENIGLHMLLAGIKANNIGLCIIISRDTPKLQIDTVLHINLGTLDISASRKLLQAYGISIEWSIISVKAVRQHRLPAFLIALAKMITSSHIENTDRLRDAIESIHNQFNASPKWEFDKAFDSILAESTSDESSHPLRPFEPPLPGFNPDIVLKDTEDQLGFDTDVKALSAVIASKDVSPPICIGLFGDWGSGKTFFMKEIRNRIEYLANISRTDERGTPFCSRIAHVDFNAWHYIDANLWASLVSHIFNSLAEALKEAPEEERKRLFQGLKTAEQQLAQARENRNTAKQKFEQADRELARLDADIQLQNQKLKRAIIEQLKSFFSQNSKIQKATQQLGIQDFITSTESLRLTLEQMRTPRGRAQAAWATLMHDGRWLRLAFLALIVAAIPLADYGMDRLLQWLGASLEDPISILVSLTGQATVFATGTATWLNSLLGKSNKAIQKLEGAQQDIADCLAQPNQEQKILHQKLARLRSEAAAAQYAVTLARQRVREAEKAIQQVESISDAQLLTEFIQQRAASGDYSKHLGLVSTVRQDFQKLSEYMHRIWEKEEPPTDTEGNPLPRIDRIVLYIDDLDRCPEKNVVQVLQALHLLLAFPLFVVIVGVDSRWILRALEEFHATLKKTTQSCAWLDEDEAWTWGTTPQSYLEKIFQIPFNTPLMEKNGFGRLIDSLTVTERSILGTSMPPSMPQANGDESPKTKTPRAATNDSREPRPEKMSPSPDDSNSKKSKEEKRRQALEKAKEDLQWSHEALHIEDEEREFIKCLLPMIPTPRAANRFVNIYRIIRATIEPHTRKDFIQDKEYQVVMILLAVMTGFPRQAPTLFKGTLATTEDPDWQTILAAIKPKQEEGETETYSNGIKKHMQPAEARDWKRLYDALACLDGIRAPTARKWAPVVAKFSFRVGRLTALAQRLQ